MDLPPDSGLPPRGRPRSDDPYFAVAPGDRLFPPLSPLGAVIVTAFFATCGHVIVALLCSVLCDVRSSGGERVAWDHLPLWRHMAVYSLLAISPSICLILLLARRWYFALGVATALVVPPALLLLLGLLIRALLRWG